MAKRKRDAPAPAEAADDDAPGPSGLEDPLTAVVYIGHLPHGFYEDELLGFFSQFGKLVRVRLSRSKKSGKPKHYAFLEFQHPDVAAIAAETMDGYFMFKQRLACRTLRKSEVHPQLFKGANRKFKKVPWRKIEAERVNRERTPAEAAARVAALLKRDRARARAIAAAGIDYEYEPLAAQQPRRAKKTTQPQRAGASRGTPGAVGAGMAGEASVYEGETAFLEEPWALPKPAAAPPADSAAAPPRGRLNGAGATDRGFAAALLALLAVTAWAVASDHGPAPRGLASRGVVPAPRGSGPPRAAAAVHTSVGAVDLRAGRLELAVTVTHGDGEYCAAAGARGAALVFASAAPGAAAARVPLCAGGPRTVVLPLQKLGAPHPFDEHTAEVRLRLEEEPAAGVAGAGAAHPPPPAVTWHASWAVSGLQVGLERKLAPHARLLAAAAGAAFDGEEGGWGSGLLDALAPDLARGGGGQLAFELRLARSSWLRVIHLAAALVQVVAVGWVGLVVLGHCVAALIVQRFLCNRVVHGWAVSCQPPRRSGAAGGRRGAFIAEVAAMRRAAVALALGLMLLAAVQAEEPSDSESEGWETASESGSVDSTPPPKKAEKQVLSLSDLSATLYAADGKKAFTKPGALGDVLFKASKLGPGQSIEVSFKPLLGGSAAKPQQAMLMASSAAHPGLAAYAVAKAKKDGQHVATLSAAAIEKQLGSVGGEMSISLLLGDPAAAVGLSGDLGSVVLPEVASGAPPKPKLLSAAHQPVNNLKPDIAHTFVRARSPRRRRGPAAAARRARRRFTRPPARPPAAPQRVPDKRAPAVVSLAFTGLALAPLAALVLYLGALGVNVSGLPRGGGALWALLFHGGIAALLGLYLLFWLRLNLAATLPLAAGLGLFIAGTGWKALGALSDARIAEAKAGATPAKKTN
ncbi:nifk [Scenedesmus sp. PABB004]|nr:nifk [Scenedesmus sp. PABB004]